MQISLPIVPALLTLPVGQFLGEPTLPQLVLRPHHRGIARGLTFGPDQGQSSAVIRDVSVDGSADETLLG